MGRPVPPQFLDKAELWPDNLVYWQAFWDLRRGRDPVIPISWIDCNTWCNAYGVPTRQMQYIQDVLVEMDFAFNARAAAKRKLEADRVKNENAKGNGRAKGLSS